MDDLPTTTDICAVFGRISTAKIGVVNLPPPASNVATMCRIQHTQPETEAPLPLAKQLRISKRPCTPRVQNGGEGGIRTHDTVARMPHFECGAFDHSATSPLCWSAQVVRGLSLSGQRRGWQFLRPTSGSVAETCRERWIALKVSASIGGRIGTGIHFANLHPASG